MAYNFTRGVQFIGDISGSDDSDRNTGIDFEEDYIALVAQHYFIYDALEIMILSFDLKTMR